jgi:DNA-binding transcriptional MerR regulator
MTSEKDYQAMIERDMIPDLDLYMDQVRQLFEKTYAGNKRDDKEKILTKTMINNYAKSKLVPPIVNKKYQTEHIMLIQMIYQLKGALSLNDIETVLSFITPSIQNETTRAEVYDDYVGLMKKQATEAEKMKAAIEADVKEVDKPLADFYTVASLVQLSAVFRKMAEDTIDALAEEQKKITSHPAEQPTDN